MIKSLSKDYSFQKDGVTQSLMQLYMACPRRFAIASHQWTQPTRLVMELGSAGHKAIETCRKEKYVFDKIITTEQKNQIEAAIDAIVPAYFVYYKKEDSKYTHQQEHVFDISIAGVRVRGKIDDILSYGRTLKLREMKFKSRISEDDLDALLPLDWQSNFYIAAMVQEGQIITEVEYDVIRYPTIKPGQKPKEIYDFCTAGIKKEPEHWFKRWTTKFDTMEVMAFTGELVQKLNEMKERKVWYRNECSCKGAFKCPYVEYCTTDKTTGLIKKKLFSELSK